MIKCEELIGIVDVMTERDFSYCMRENSRFKSWSWLALEALYDYLQELSLDMGEPIVFDPVSLAGQYSLYEAPTDEELVEELARDFTLNTPPSLRSEENEAAYRAWLMLPAGADDPEPPCDLYDLDEVLNELRESTTVILVPGSNIAVIVDTNF